MKTFNQLCLLAMLVLGISCGNGGQSTASLVVSQSFIVSNTGYSGGLIIEGKNSTTSESFIIEVDNGLESKVKLSKGNWTFKAVGWDATGSGKFSGEIYCGLTQKDISQDLEVIDINISALGCTAEAFAKASNYTATETPGLRMKKLGSIALCNTFTPNDTTPQTSIQASLPTSYTASTFCANKPEFIGEVKSLRIYSYKKALTDAEATIGTTYSTCFNPSNSGITLTSAKIRLPYAGMGFAIVTYKDGSCSDKLAQYDFKNGLAGEYGNEFDNFLTSDYPDSSVTKLFLPANNIKRAMSGLTHLLPAIQCVDGSSLVKCRTSRDSTSQQLHGLVGGNYQFSIGKVSACPTLTSNLSGLNYSCSISNKGEGIIVYSPTTAGTGQLTIDGVNYNIEVTAPGTAADDAYTLSSYLARSIGDSNPTIPRSFYQNTSTLESPDYYGVLQKVREMFSGNGAAGLFSPLIDADRSLTYEAYCQSLVGTREITLLEDGETKTYRVQMGNISESASTYICEKDPDVSSCATDRIFTKQINIGRVLSGTVLPEMVIKFNCSYQFGKVESISDHTEDLKRHIERQVISWNTEISGDTITQRFDETMRRSEFDFSSVWTLSKETREMSRVMKTDNLALELENYKFEIKKNSSNWDTRFEVSQAKTYNGAPDKLCYKKDGMTSNFNLNIALNIIGTRTEPSTTTLLSAGGLSSPSTVSFGTNYFYLTDWTSAGTLSNSPDCEFSAHPASGVNVNGVYFGPGSILQTPFLGTFTLQ